jgi:hypothetical protein
MGKKKKNKLKEDKKQEILDNGGAICSCEKKRYCVNEVFDVIAITLKEKKGMTKIVTENNYLRDSNVDYQEDSEKYERDIKKYLDDFFEKYDIVLKEKIKIIEYDPNKETSHENRKCYNKLSPYSLKIEVIREGHDKFDKRDKIYIYRQQKCSSCSAKHYETEKKGNNKKKKENEKNLREGEKLCSTCIKAKPMSDFIGEKGEETVRCLHCRQIGKNADKNRNYTRYKYLTNERILYKKMYKKGRRYENLLYCLNNRIKQQEKRGLIKSLDELDIENISDTKNIDISLSKEECIDFFKKECFYCGLIPDNEHPNGIDRLNSSKGYTKSNCVSACRICNYMKRCMSPLVFIERIKHIMSYLKIVDEEYENYDCFPDYKSNHKYNSYKKESIKSGKIFELTEKEFLEIKSNDCHICGKKSYKNHCNGIDRFDNDIGYILDNCRPCCGGCNFMKKDLEYNTFINHIGEIYFNNKYFNKTTNVKGKIKMINKNIEALNNEIDYKNIEDNIFIVHIRSKIKLDMLGLCSQKSQLIFRLITKNNDIDNSYQDKIKIITEIGYDNLYGDRNK